MALEIAPLDTETPPPHRASKGWRLVLALALMGTASVASGLIWANQSSRLEQIADASSVPAIVINPVFMRDVFVAEPVTSHAGKLARHETLTELVTRLGASPEDAARALQVVYQNDLLDPRKLRPGLNVDVHLENGALEALTIHAEPIRKLMIERVSASADWRATELKARVSEATLRVAGSIDTSIYDAARALGADDQHVVDFAGAFAYDVDFQREIYPGDTFEMLFKAQVDERGQRVAGGEILYAALNGKALTRGFYRFTPSDDGVADYYDMIGESATKFLMKTPINGARISSGFGKRRHPISGYSKLHKGTDFAAPTGTPVYAAGHGTIEKASRYGGYGNYVRIRHANEYKTAYAHLSRYGKGMKPGKKVRQGDVIGYVGSTGASTGPHLHYEVYVKGKPVNAMGLKLPTGRKLAETPGVFAEFEAERDRIDALRLASAAPKLPAGQAGTR